MTSVKQIQLLLVKSQREVGSSGVFLLSLLPEIIQLTVDSERHISQISSRCPNPSAAWWNNTPHAVDPRDLSEGCCAMPGGSSASSSDCFSHRN